MDFKIYVIGVDQPWIELLDRDRNLLKASFYGNLSTQHHLNVKYILKTFNLDENFHLIKEVHCGTR